MYIKTIFFSLVFCFVTICFSQENNGWLVNYEEVYHKSVQENKPIMANFTGSDWCGWCIRLQKAVFLKPEFTKWANKNVILVELDFPKRTPIAPELLKQNRELANIFGVRGYPTVWFVTPERLKDGKTNFNKLGSQGASPLDANAWIAGANRIIKNK